MKYCKKCGILYASVLAACPKCGVNDSDGAPEREAAAGEKRRNWISLIIGIPALIFILYLTGWLIKQLSA